jgi:TM2 domain-containing membrane protein YozV
VARGPYPQRVTYDPNQPGYTNPIDGYPTQQSPYPPPMPPGAVPGYGAPTMPYYGVDAYGRPLSDKSKVIAGILGILLGGFGVGRFYIGDTKTGVLMLVVTIFTCGLGHFWGLIDGIMILINGGVDAQGRVLRD